MRWITRIAARALVALAMAGLAGSALADGGEIVQWFPAELPEDRMDTRWRISWGIERNDGDGEILFIKEAHFRRAPGEPEIRVLGDCRLSEIFVGYGKPKNNQLDISSGHLPLLELGPDALGPSCLTPPRIYRKDGKEARRGFAVGEVHDDQVRWMNCVARARRGQTFYLWSVLGGSSYSYVMLYEFRDDGLIGLRLGATAQDLFSSEAEFATHVHVGCWRINLPLGDAGRTRVIKSHLDTRVRESFAEELHREARIKWEADRFTGLRVESRALKNGHDPDHFIGYDFVPIRNGSARYFGVHEEFTHHDYWVTRAEPDELKFVDLPEYETGEELKDHPLTVWYQTPALHKPRDEDFGPVGTNANLGVAITRWAVVELKPRNLFPKTPLYTPLVVPTR